MTEETLDSGKLINPENEEILKGFGGLGVILLTHGATIACGIYKGSGDAKGIAVNPHLEYIIPANILGTALAAQAFKGPNDPVASEAARGGILGLALTPFEYVAGYVIGYTTSKYLF